MNEFNFFETKKKKKNNFKLPKISIGFQILWALGCIATLFLVYVYIDASINYNKVINETNLINDEIIALQTTNIIGSEEDDNESGEYSKDDLQFALDEIINIQEEKFITSEVIGGIREKMPDGVFLTSIQIEYDNIKIDGYSNTSQKIALFQYQLGQINRIKSVFVPTILEDFGSYSFTLIAQIEEENNEEIN